MFFKSMIPVALAALSALVPLGAYADYKAANTAWESRNWDKVYQECKADSDAGERNCQMHLAYLFKNGLGVEKNLTLANEILKKCADSGQVNCQLMLGDSYRYGAGVKLDYAEALRLFRLSAAQGSLLALNNLGSMYRSGQGVEKSPAEAAKHFRVAAEKGNGSAQANLADLYRVGDGVEKSGELAFQWATKSSQQNFGSGWNVLGLLYRDGFGVQKDGARAVEAFKKAFDPSVRDRALIAYANLGYVYLLGQGGVPINRDEAAKWAEEGAKFKQRDSMRLLATVLAQGAPNTPVDQKRAFQLALEAYQLGSVYASELLGLFYRDGVGVSVDFQLAAKYFAEARDAGVIAAYAHLARMYSEGQGVDKDKAKAHEYLLVARSKIDQLGPGNRKYVENYFASLAAQPAQQQVAGALRQQNGLAVVDSSQQILLDRIEKLQKQLDSLQSSPNAVGVSQVIPSQVIMAPRKALVIGNDKYTHVQTLLNARQDASAIANSLGQLGYVVTLRTDLNEKGFKQALRDFRSSLEGGDEVLFFFAGHGVQLGAANYLLPTDIKGDNEDQVKDEAIELQRVLDDLKSKNAKFALAIIDACRDNPFKQSGRAVGGRGLAPTTAATGQMVMFSAGAGQQALDKLGNGDKEKNGVFTRVLLKEMTKPGVPVDRVLRNVRNEVVRLSKSVGHEQTPALYDQAVGDFYFSLK